MKRKPTDTYASLITSARLSRGVTRYRLAIDAGLSQSHLHDIESGKYSPKAVTLARLAAALGVAVTDLCPSDIFSS